MSANKNLFDPWKMVFPSGLKHTSLTRLVLVQSTVTLYCLIGISFSCSAGPLGTWKSVLSNPPGKLTGMAYGNGTFVGVGGD